MDHIRGVHDVPWEVQSCSLEHFLPAWTVTRQVWMDSLKPQHSGISMDVLLFSDIHLSLVHHYRIHKRGLPHIAFWKNYMSQLCALLPLPVAQPVDGVLSPSSTGHRSLRPAGSVEFVGKSLRTTRRAHRRMRPVCVMETSVGDLPVLTLKDPSAAQGGGGGGGLRLSASVDTNVSGSEWGWPVVGSASGGVGRCGSASERTWPIVRRADSDGLIIPELGVAPLEDSGTDVDDELSTPDGREPLCVTRGSCGCFPRRDIPRARSPFRPDHICVLM